MKLSKFATSKGANGASLTVRQLLTVLDGRAEINPAAAMSDRPQSAVPAAAEEAAAEEEEQPAMFADLTAAVVAAAAGGRHTMRVLSVGGQGQGKAMSCGLENATSELIGQVAQLMGIRADGWCYQMESDDERPADAFAQLLAAFEAAQKDGIDAVCSQVGTQTSS